jgi:rhamnosyltransferase
MKFIGVVIFYKFDLTKLKESILTYIDSLDKLIIWRNSEISQSDILSVFSDDYRQKIEVLGNGENIFIAGALNRAVEYARTNGYTHILTMDQDSKFGQQDAEKYRKTIEGGDNYNNVIFCPLVVSTKGIKEQRGMGIEKVYKNITSGSIYPLKVFDMLGGFREDLKIDYVDYEYSFRASKFGVDMYRINDVILLQEYGNIVRHRIGYTLGYSPLRLFFQTRNRIIVHDEYKDLGLSSLHPSISLYVKEILKILFFEDKKFKKIKAILFGIVCGKFHKSKFDKWIIKNQFYV